MSRAEVSARNEAGNLGLSSAIAGLSSACTSAVTALWPRCGFAQSATGGVGGAWVQGSRLAGSTRHSVTGSGAA